MGPTPTTAYCCVCDSAVEARELFSKTSAGETFAIVACPQCNLQFVSPAPSDQALERHYQQSFEHNYGNYVEAADIKHAHFRAKLDQIEQHCNHRGKLLDVGCANGYLLSVAQDRGWEVTGVELNPAVASHLPESLSTKVHFGTVADYPGPGDFDLVTLFDVLEHVPDPRATLERCALLARPHALVAIQIPSVDSLGARAFGSRWMHYAPPSHLTYFSATTITRLLERLGFEVLSTSWTRKLFTVEYLWRQVSTQYLGSLGASLKIPAPLNFRFPVSMSERLVIARNQG